MNGHINFSIADLEQLMWDAVLKTFQQAMVKILSDLVLGSPPVGGDAKKGENPSGVE